MPEQTKILCLKAPSESIKEFGRELNLEVDFCEVIEIKPCLNAQSILAKMCSGDALVFTSFNAVQILAPYFRKESRSVYCVGERGAELLKKYYENVKSAATVRELAEIVISDQVKSLIHFKGSLSLNTLKEAMLKANVAYSDELVYTTKEIHPEIKNLTDYAALLFFSPSGVRSFLAHNQYPNSIIGAIGETTRKAIALDEVVFVTNSSTHELLKRIRRKYESIANV